ncbi:hypothetical protein [Deinococcus arcticus]|uniref:hypothetical protein n=1 Tax=Deinococcus arcticus TaxID=2136176 RepID=UPI0011B210A9|nr:hypothetical protein [Deinococcus arcticus]
MTPRLLQQARLLIPFTARMSKGQIRRGQVCHLVGYILYASRNACNLCYTDAKAERQVVIEVGGKTLHSGLNCFEDVSGITAKQLEMAVKGHLGVAMRLRNLSSDGFKDESAMLSHIEGLLHLVASPAERAHMTDELRRLRKANHFMPRDLRWLEDVLDLLALLQLAHRDWPAYARMIDAVFGEPGKRAEEARNRLTRVLLSNPAKLTVSQATELRRAMRVLLEFTPPVHFTPAVVPWSFPDREAYLAGLAAHYRQQAEAGHISAGGRLQLQHDLVHQGQRRPTAADLLTNLGVPCILAVYEHPTIEALDLFGFQGLRLIERGNLLPRGAMDEQVYVASAVHEAVVRTDPERRRTSNSGVTHPPGPGDTTSVPFRAAALWRPDAWCPVYTLWHQHGRERLLTFPALTQA